MRPAISRLPNTENTTAGSVAATAVPTSRARCQLMPATYRAATAVPAAVTSVPAIPVQTMAAAAVRNRRLPMCIPPSNKMIASATVTTRSTVVTGSAVAVGHSCAAIDRRDEEERGRGHPEPGAEPVGEHGRRPGQADHENDEAELAFTAHRVRV